MIVPIELVRKVAREGLERIDAALERADAERAAGAINLAQKLNRLDLVRPHREKLIVALQQDQDPDTGLFPKKDWHVPFVPVLLRTTSLAVLRARPVHPVRELQRILSSD
ncbi:MAG: hypothetical protein AMS16_05165, partial [Planctomycetes bacterium DG_58]